MYLTKTKYCRAVTCMKQLWLDKYMPEAYDNSVLNSSVLESGNEIGELAKSLFGEYSEVGYSDNIFKMVSETKTLLKKGKTTIAEAAFAFEGNFCSVDILKKTKKGFEIYEVKSSTHVKDIHIHDLSFQLYVLKSLGMNIRKAFIVHIDGTYVRNGELEPEKLFCIEEVTQAASELVSVVKKTISEADLYIKSKKEPKKQTGMFCKEPYECGFWGHCMKSLSENSVFDVSRLSLKTKFEYYYNGIVDFSDLLESNAELSETQVLQIRSEVENLPTYIDREKIIEFMNELSYPIYFLDFETYQQPIPLYDGIRPYMQIPFQYSLHFINDEKGKLHHREFLAESDQDTRRELAESLCRDIPDNVCVTAYNMGFEKGRIRELAGLFPDLSDHLMKIHDNIFDLMIPFQKRWYYDRKMKGSYSIKYVLPALCPNDPELDYKNLDGIHNGNEASFAFSLLNKLPSDEIDTFRKQLLAYCRLDTLAMVKVWERLKQVASDLK